MIVFLDTSVLLTAFGTWRIAGAQSRLLTTPDARKLTFEKCVCEAFLAFRGVGGKKPDEGRQDWARRYLTKAGDPVPLGDAAGKLHGGSLPDAHYWVGQADEAQWARPETVDDWPSSAEAWRAHRAVIQNHQRYEALFAEFREFLREHDVEILSYEQIYEPAGYSCRLIVMDGISERSTIPSEDFEIVVAGLLSGAALFVSTDTRLLRASNSVEQNLRWCEFVHLDDALAAVEDGAVPE